MILFFLLLKIQNREQFKFDLNLNFTDFFIIIINLLLILLLFILPSNIRFYYTLYPTLFMDLKLPVFHDTTFHASLISSILNFGYPGTGLHDVQFLFYHFLSHYVDALILKIIKLDPLESYALFFYFKFFILLNFILLFIAKNIKYLTLKRYLLSVFFFFPTLLYNYDIFVGSAFILAFTLILVFFKSLSEILEKDYINHVDFFKINFIVILIYFSKSSNGIVLFLIVYSLLFKNNFLNKINYKYLFHFFFLILIISISTLRLSRNEGVLSSSFEDITTFYITEVLVLSKIIIILIINNFSKTKINFFYPFIFSSVIIFLLKIITAANYYFFFLMSFDFVFNLFFFKKIINLLLDKNFFFKKKLLKKLKIISIYFNFILNNLVIAILFFIKLSKKKISEARLYFLVIIISLSTLYNSSKVTHLLDFNLKKFFGIFVYYNLYPTENIYIDKDVFSRSYFVTNVKKLGNVNDWTALPEFSINDKILSIDEHLSAYRMLKKNRFEIENIFINYDRPMLNLKNNLNNYIIENKLDRKRLLLFFPKEIYENYFFINYENQYASEKIFFSNFLYSLLGVPLINGVYSNHMSNEGSYGFSLYKMDSLLKDKKSFIEDFRCKNKDVIVIDKVNFREFDLIKCINQ